MAVAVEEHAHGERTLGLLEEYLDLSNVRMKLLHPGEGKSRSKAELDAMEREYRRFLALHLMYPDEDIVPCKLVDEIWHKHILDTIAYREDCDRIFGRFLDHYPYFGMRDEQDATALIDAYAATIERYRAAFGEPPPDTWISHEASKCKRTACKPQKCK